MKLRRWMAGGLAALALAVQVPTVRAEADKPLEPIAVEYWNPPREDVEALARLVWGEARGVKTRAEQEAVIWCVLNRVDSPDFPDTVVGVVTQRKQFTGYSRKNPLEREFLLMADEILWLWHKEKQGCPYIERCLPADYCYFAGNGKTNRFSTSWPIRRSECYRFDTKKDPA